MMTAGSFNEVYLGMLAKVQRANPQPSRDGHTNELHPGGFQFTDVGSRSLTLCRRRKNLALQLMEFLWIWAGSDDLDPLVAACPQWKEYSDDGLVVRGSYGKRLRQYGYCGRDQVDGALEVLRKSPCSRQCVMAIWDPIDDLNIASQHVPCNNLLYFLIRDGKLDCTAVLRSNDIYWGTPYNVFNWTQLQCILAARLGVEPGRYIHFANSLHLYDRHQADADRVLQAPESPALNLPVDGVTDEQLQWLWWHAQSVALRGDGSEVLTQEFRALPLFWKDYALALNLCFYVKKPTCDVEKAWHLVAMMNTELQVEAAHVLYGKLAKMKYTISFMEDWLDGLEAAQREYVRDGRTTSGETFETPVQREG